MIRTILRSVQNSLVLASVLLVVLALQRLQSYDVTHAYFNDPHQQQQHHHHNHRESKRHGASTAAESNVGHYNYEQEDDDDDDSTRPYPAIVDSAFWRINQYHPYHDHPNQQQQQQRHHPHKDASPHPHHQVVLGREYNIGLFRFFLPRLEKRSEGVTAAVVPASSSSSTSATTATATGTATNPGKTSQWQVQPVRTTVALVVDLVNLFPQQPNNNSTKEATTTTTTITPSECKSILDAATVLKWSLLLLQRQIHEEEEEDPQHHYHLRTKSGHSTFHDNDHHNNRPRTTKPKPSTTLHALLPYKNHNHTASANYYDPNTARCYDNVTRVLARLGYRVISSREQLQPNPNQQEEQENNGKQCEGKEEESTPEWRQYAKTLSNTHVVVRLPLTSILVVPPPQPQTKNNRRNRRRRRRRSLSSSLHSEEEYASSSSLLSRDAAVSVLVWKDPNTRCNATVHHCHEPQQLCGISKRLSIVNFASSSSIHKESSSSSLSCPLPNPCTNVDQKESPSCHSWQQQWLQMYRQAKSVKDDKIHCSN